MTNLICTIGDKLFGHVAKHWTVYHKFFYRAAWSVEAVSRLLLTRIVLPLIEQEGDEGSDGAIELIFDGTTTERSGKQVAFAGYAEDSVRAVRQKGFDDHLAAGFQIRWHGVNTPELRPEGNSCTRSAKVTQNSSP